MSSNNFPDYHDQPLRLTIDEIENPTKVIYEFFLNYHLPDIRSCLHNWLQDSFHKEILESKEHFSEDLLPEDIATLKRQVRALEVKLRAAELRAHAAELIIDIAEKDLGLDIRKKSGTKQSRK